MHTPVIEDIKVVTRGDVRRAKLYYLRELRGKKAKIKEKRETGPRASGSARTAVPASSAPTSDAAAAATPAPPTVTDSSSPTSAAPTAPAEA